MIRGVRRMAPTPPGTWYGRHVEGLWLAASVLLAAAAAGGAAGWCDWLLLLAYCWPTADCYGYYWCAAAAADSSGGGGGAAAAAPAVVACACACVYL